MGYKRADTNSFAEFQMHPSEGFGAAVTGDINSTEEVSRLAMKGMKQLPAGLQGLNGYEGYPSHLSGYPEFAGEFGQDTTAEIASIAQRNMDRTPAGGNDDAFSGFEGVEDDAFAGYGDTTASIADLAQRSALEEDEVESDGYGGFAGGPEESFHTYFHKASMARTDTQLIRELAKAVKSVSDDTPASIRKQYYDLAKEMLMRRKNTDMHHLDLERAEIESNIGWLINPSLPKTGGFNAVLQKAVGSVGAKLAKGEIDQIKMQRALAMGKKARGEVEKYTDYPMISGLGDFSGSKITYIGLGLAGILAVAVAYYLMKNKGEATALKKRSKRRKRK